MRIAGRGFSNTVDPRASKGTGRGNRTDTETGARSTPSATRTSYLDTGAQRIWSFFRTQAEPLSLKVAACWPSSWAITIVWSAAWAETQENKAAIKRLLISLVVVNLVVSALRLVLCQCRAGGPSSSLRDYRAECAKF